MLILLLFSGVFTKRNSRRAKIIFTTPNILVAIIPAFITVKYTIQLIG